MEPIRYRPSDALRWLEDGASASRERAKSNFRKLADLDPGTVVDKVGQGFKKATSAVIDFGKGAMADQAARKAALVEYVLLDDRIDIVEGTTIRSIPYRDVVEFREKGDRITVILRKGTYTIKPLGTLVAGRVKAVIGWERNGLDAPYRLLAEEWAARCGLDLGEETPNPG